MEVMQTFRCGSDEHHPILEKRPIAIIGFPKFGHKDFEQRDHPRRSGQRIAEPERLPAGSLWRVGAEFAGNCGDKRGHRLFLRQRGHAHDVRSCYRRIDGPHFGVHPDRQIDHAPIVAHFLPEMFCRKDQQWRLCAPIL